jgi:hypothetical protein
VRTVVVDNGNSGQFLDKPWIATDIPRAGAGTCTIPGNGGVADQVVPAGIVYDVRAALSNPADATGQTFQPSTEVSRSQWAFDTTPLASQPSGVVGMVQLEFNPVNWPLYAGGTVPFLGDDIDLAPARTVKPPIAPGAGWTYNADPNDTGVLHAAWTDNRDVLDHNETWTAWSPPATAGCTDGNQASQRNQNVCTARLSRGLVVGVEGNSRLVAGQVSERAFAVFVQNATSVARWSNLSSSFVVLLEAWRKGTDSNGRLYTIVVTATDADGRSTSASTFVTVPHNSAGRPSYRSRLRASRTSGSLESAGRSERNVR